jgi:hypothetical protein
VTEFSWRHCWAFVNTVVLFSSPIKAANSLTSCGKYAVFWDLMPYSLGDWYQLFERTCCLHLQDRRLPKYVALLSRSPVFVYSAMRTSENLGKCNLFKEGRIVE